MLIIRLIRPGFLAFLTAAGYASANVRFGVGDPSFVRQEFTVAPFKVRHGIV